MKKFEAFLQFIKEKGWIIEEMTADDKKFDIPDVYKGKIGEFEEIAQKYKLIANPKDTVRLVIGDSLENENTDDSWGIQWDTFKNICIDASDDGGKTETEWWDKHFPFIISVDYGEYKNLFS